MSSDRQWHLRDVTLGYAGKAILRHVSLSAQLGDFLAVTGDNGTGKSCFLRTFGGEIAPLSGHLSRPDGFATDGVGIVPQVTDLNLRLPLRLDEMVALGAAGLRDPFLRDHVDEALAMVGLNQRRRQAWDQSSGGERQRTLVARALVRRPEVLLLDEATSNLDAAGADEIFTALRQQCDAKKMLVIAVLHDAGLAQRYATRHLRLASGAAEVLEPAR